MQNNINEITNRATCQRQLWQEIINHAEEAGLNPKKFANAHREIVEQIVSFLFEDPADGLPLFSPNEKLPTVTDKITNLTWLPTRLKNRLNSADGFSDLRPVRPIIICGEPGTGKTTFLYLLDIILRQMFNLPDNIETDQRKQNGRVTHIVKRAFNGRQISLLSVKKWGQLLHFHAWDAENHKMDRLAQDAFIKSALMPMRILFADEVEMTGYSPTIPDLARHGILVVGSSNQYEFKQLVDRAIPPHIYRFHGLDMRLGDPADAVVSNEDPLQSLFLKLKAQPYHQDEQLRFRLLAEDITIFLFDFQTAVAAPLLEPEWVKFFQDYQRGKVQPATILLFDNFSLDVLKSNYNNIIRFVSLFDAIEQLGLGVLVKNDQQPSRLSKSAITNLKTHVYNAIGVPEEIKQRTVVGLDRCTSRLGQAGSKARSLTKPGSL